jgi:DNA invertase Pin-like site-specific DNA recombinase
MPIAPEYLHLVYPDLTFYALLYGRNSRDPKKKGRSVSAQLTDGRGLCDRFGWPILEEFRDSNLSASRHARRERDDFEVLLDTIEYGETPPGGMRICVAYEASRYYRDLEAYVRLRNACFHAGVLLCYNNNIYDLSKREDRKATAMDAIAAEDEAEGIWDRNVRTARQTAEKGAPWGKLPYGYMRKYDERTGELIGQFEDPDQGPYVMRSLAHIDAGQSMYSLIQWLRSEPKAARPDGKAWNKDNVRYMLLNRAYLGERLHLGTYRKATWEPLKAVHADGISIPGLDEPEGRAMFHRVTKKLMSRQGSGRDTRVVHLLSFLALCGPCGDHAVLSTQKEAGNGGRKYQCDVAQDVAVKETLLDAYVEEAVMAWLRNKEAARAALVGDTAELEEARVMANTRHPDGRPLLSLASLSQKELDLLPRIEKLQKQVESVTGVPELVQRLLAAPDPEVVWDGVPATEDAPARPGLTLEQKREAIRSIVTVRLFKARARGVKRIEPGRVQLSFVGEPGFRDRPLRAPATAPSRLPGPRAASSGTSGGSRAGAAGAS